MSDFYKKGKGLAGWRGVVSHQTRRAGRGMALVFLGLLLLACPGTALLGRAAEETASLPKLDVPENQFRSVFVQDPRIGKDPFFPVSKRRPTKEPVVIDPTPKPNVPGGTVDWTLFELKGVSIRAGKNLALINRYTFAEGEEQEMKLAGGKVLSVRCESITQGSVVIRIKDETHELTREVLK